MSEDDPRINRRLADLLADDADHRSEPTRGYIEQLQRSIDDPYLDTIDPPQEQA